MGIKEGDLVRVLRYSKEYEKDIYGRPELGSIHRVTEIAGEDILVIELSTPTEYGRWGWSIYRRDVRKISDCDNALRISNEIDII